MTSEMAFQGAVLGLSAGLAPGPLFAFVMSESLKQGTVAGLKAASAPLITDPPIIALCFFLVLQASRADFLLGLIALGGFGLLFHMGYENLKTVPVVPDLENASHGTLKRAVLINFLSPHPYLFWISVGVPLMLRGGDGAVGGAALFLGCFYGLLVGSKLLLAVVVGRYRSFLSGNLYQWITRILGILLMGFALMLLRDAVRLLGSAAW